MICFFQNYAYFCRKEGKMKSILDSKIVLIGAGNVATHIALGLASRGVVVSQVWSRTLESSRKLACRLGTVATNDVAEIATDADFYIFSVSDNALPHVISEVCARSSKGIFLHTAGSMSMKLFAPYVHSYGVLYPMQTFSKAKDVDFSLIPCFVEASDESTLRSIRDLASVLSSRVYELTEEQRGKLHIAAVFACNFSNCCFALAAKLLRSNAIDFDVMLPLIDEMVNKVHVMDPVDAQTGPAARGDTEVMDAHMRSLDASPDMQRVYEIMSATITKLKQDKIHL